MGRKNMAQFNAKKVLKLLFFTITIISLCLAMPAISQGAAKMFAGPNINIPDGGLVLIGETVLRPDNNLQVTNDSDLVTAPVIKLLFAAMHAWCQTTSTGTNCLAPDPNTVFSFPSSTADGAGACNGTTFNIVAGGKCSLDSLPCRFGTDSDCAQTPPQTCDALAGSFVFEPQSDVFLTSDQASNGATCTITYDIKGNQLPAFDVDPVTPGSQTWQIGFAKAIATSKYCVSDGTPIIVGGTCTGTGQGTCSPGYTCSGQVAATATGGGTNIATLSNPITPPPVVVPTMTEWGMIIFMVLAGLGSLYYLRRHKNV
jgi:hypothetical protein